MGFDGIPALHESLDDLRDCAESFLGLDDEAGLAGAVSWVRQQDGTLEICRLMVHPRAFRRGLATALLDALDHAEPARRAVVSTGTANDPGLVLYTRRGFTPVGTRQVAPGATITILERHGAPPAGLACGSIRHMTEITDVSGAFGYGDSILAGELVRLRGVRDEDLPTLAKWEMDPGRLTTLSNKVAPPSEAAAKERIAKWSANEKDDLGFAIETLDDPPVLVGNIGLFGAHPKDRCATIGIALGREHIGRGYGTDAMRVIVDYGFRELGLHRIQLGVAPFNPAGIRAYEKAGFVEEGRLRESVLHDGRWYDEVLMSILDREWAARRSSSR